MVRDLSATGARLHVEGSVIAPAQFVLIIELDGLEADCEVIYRRLKEIGVKFLAPPRAVKPRRVQAVKPLR
jgi:nitrogenase molybdenum-iron protein alpha/beta subunit